MQICRGGAKSARPPRDWATTGSRGRIAPTRIMQMI